MPKIQVLNEKQLCHLQQDIDSIVRKTYERLYKERKDKALTEIEKYDNHEIIIKRREEQKLELEKIEKLIELNKLVKVAGTDKDGDPMFKITGCWCYYTTLVDKANNIIAGKLTVKDIEEKYNEVLIAEKLILSEKNYGVHNSVWYLIESRLSALLAVTEIASYEEIKQHIIDSIDIDSFFVKQE